MSILELTKPISELSMVGPIYSKRLAKLAIYTVKDLLFHFPHRHDDLSRITTISALEVGEIVTIKGTVVTASNQYTRTGKQIQKAVVTDHSGQIHLTWFNQKFVVDNLKKITGEVYFSGKVQSFNGKLGLVSPEYEIARPEMKPIHTAGLIPIYPETYGVSSKWLRSRIAPLLKNDLHLTIADPLPESIKSSENLINLPDALNAIHFPQTLEALQAARRRLAFDELFLLQLASQARKYAWNIRQTGYPIYFDPSELKRCLDHLPFTLTQAQLRASNDLLTDFKKPHPMNRLLQGDVGSGKTVVAAIGMIAARQNGFRSILMAPTEILAKQHFDTISQLLHDFNVSIKLVTSSTTKKDKQSLAHDQSDILIGTHALLHHHLPSNIGFVVVDEQHRFGVEQRARLLQLPQTPHLLSMTATPIPRTIALTLYGELDLSVIDEMPIGRKPIKTWVVEPHKRDNAYIWIEDQVKQHNQAFIVCPLIEESEAEKLQEVKAVKAEFDRLRQLVFPDLRLGLLHGKMKSSEKNAVLDQFKSHQLDILVSTPVIEVGIDIKNATIMVIEGAERFGLAQLHQLRGRVGRGDKNSFCLLFTTSSQPIQLKRLKALETTNSGFKLSEIDLDLRGPGEMYGLKQHGFDSLKVASFADHELITATHSHAVELIARDPHLSTQPLLQAAVHESIQHHTIEPN